MTQVIRRRQATVREGVTAAVLTSWCPAALGEPVPDLLRKTRLAEEISGYEPSWGEDWGIGPATHIGRGPGVQHQARLASRRRAQSPVWR
jgi:hypothetical protein